MSSVQEGLKQKKTVYGSNVMWSKTIQGLIDVFFQSVT